MPWAAHRRSFAFFDDVAVREPDLVPAGVRVTERAPDCERVVERVGV